MGWDSYPTWSPQGDRLLFVRTIEGSSDFGEFLSELYLVIPDGTGLTSVMRTDWVTLRPAWSPDGKRIVFASTAHERIYNLYVINIDGTGLTKITRGLFTRRWSPDGSLLAFFTPTRTRYLSPFSGSRHLGDERGRHPTTPAHRGPSERPRSLMVARWFQDPLHEKPRGRERSLRRRANDGQRSLGHELRLLENEATDKRHGRV